MIHILEINAKYADFSVIPDYNKNIFFRYEAINQSINQYLFLIDDSLSAAIH